MKIHSSFILAILFCLLLTACDPVNTIEAAEVVNQPQISPSDNFEVHFSSPGSDQADAQRGGPDSHLADAIRSASLTVDAALYDLNLWSIRDALIYAHEQGVMVRVVVEANYLEKPEIQALINAGITVLTDLNDNLMHNKFLIIDRSEIWTGSMNMTLNGAYHNDNNLLRIRSTRAAAAYLVEFEEMFIDRRFGPASPDGTASKLTVDGTELEIYFSPDDGTADRIIELIEGAEESVYFMAFSFTSDDIANALMFAEAQGVTVAGVMDASQYSSNIGGEFDRFADASLNVYLDGNPDRMHHKVFIVDEEIVITGSYNFSASAERRNDENTVIIHDPWLARLYLQEFERVFIEAQE